MRAYRTLLLLYPASFRAEYGGQMADIFARRHREASGPSARLLLWADAARDVLANAVLAHADVLRQDLRAAGRSLRAAPGFALTAILVSALGVAATTASFSVTDHVLLRPLPFPSSDRLVKVWQAFPAAGYNRMELSPGNFRDLDSRITSLERFAAFTEMATNLVGDGEPARLEVARVTWDLFEVLGVQPALGRTFTEADDASGVPGTAVLGHSLWTNRFEADPSVVGRKIVLDDQPYEVIGVMPPQFAFPDRDAQLYTTFRFAPEALVPRDDNYLVGVGRLRDGATVETARAELQSLMGRLEADHPRQNAGVRSTVIAMRDDLSPQSRLLVTAVFGAALCVLLIACSNLAGLLTARALARRRELAVRTALGAGRDRLVRQLFTESLVLSLAGGALGVALATVATPLLARLVPVTLPMATPPGVDLRVLGFAALATVATGVGFGVLPALRSVAHVDTTGLREGGRAGTGAGSTRLRSALVVAEVTVSVVLLVGAGLLTRALLRLQAVDPGFEPRGAITLRTTLSLPRYETVARRDQFLGAVLRDAKALPGVTHAAYTSALPMVWRGGIWPITSGADLPRDTKPTASLRFVTPGYFAALGIPLLSGRDVSGADTQGSSGVAVVSRSFADKHWPGQDPVGRTFQFGGLVDGKSPFGERTVVGVVGNVRVRGLERESEPQFYLAHQQVEDGSLIGYMPQDLVVRSTGDPAALAGPLREIVARADPQQPVASVRLLSEIVEQETVARSTQVRVLGGFAALALVLAAVGLYGLLAFNVTSRTAEIGVRLALGAPRASVLGLVLKDGVRLAGAGLLVGTVLGFFAGRGLEALLAGVSPRDAATFAGAAAVVAVAAASGTLVPALRAVRVSPLVALRSTS
jgi:predicted permease